MKGKCPFLRSRGCREDCVFYRRGVRYYNDGRKPEPFEDCAFNVIADSLENLVMRSIGQQKAIESLRNEVAANKALLQQLGGLIWQGMGQRMVPGKGEDGRVEVAATVIKDRVQVEGQDTDEAKEEGEAKIGDKGE